jgi:hypothetical protein
MTSNAYIATDGTTVMKVGKANDVKRRGREIAIPIDFTIACLDEAAAFRVESNLRDFVKEKGGIRHQGTIDYFKFDPQIYAMLCEFTLTVDANAVNTKKSRLKAFFQEEIEIQEFRLRYYKLINDEMKKENELQLERLRVLYGETEIERLHAVIGVLEYRLERAEAKNDHYQSLLQEVNDLNYRLKQLEADDNP